MFCLGVELDRDGSQTCCSFNPLNFSSRRASWNATVHLKRSKCLVILGNKGFRTESIQTKKLGTHGHCGKLVCLGLLHGNEGNNIAYLTVESIADSIKYSPRFKRLSFCSQ